MAMRNYVDEGIMMRKRFEKSFDDEEKLIEDFHDHVKHYLSMAQGLRIGNITEVADYLKYALKSQLSSYNPDRDRGFWSEYHGDESVSDTAAQISYRGQYDLYLYIMKGVVHRRERHRFYIKTYACYAADIEWTVGSLHADNEVGKDVLRRAFNEANTSEDNVTNALRALMGESRPGIGYR